MVLFPCKEIVYFLVVLFSVQQNLASENVSFDRKFIGLKKGSTPKYWMKYIMKSMVSILETQWCDRNTCQLLTAAEYFSLKSYIFHAHFSKVNQPNLRCMGWKKPPIEELSPSIGYQFYWSDFKKCDLFASKFHLIFLLNGELRLNITFIKLQMREFLGRCSKDQLIVESFDQIGAGDTFSYCGILSPFDLYPSSFNVSFSVELYILIPVNLFVVFRVISDNLIKSYTAFKMNDSLAEMLSLYYFPATKVVTYTYRICLKKYLGIFLNLVPSKDSYITLYVGPGVLFDKIEMGSKNRNLNLKTFQCVLRIRNKNQKHTNNHIHIAYKSFNLPRISVYLTEYEQLVSYPKGKCKNTDSLCILDIRCSVNMHVNITISSAVYTGQSNSHCMLGGVAFYDYKNKNFLESLLLCNRFNYFQLVQAFFQRSVVSRSSSVMLILYSYKEYSQLKFMGSASVSMCRGIQINICSIYYLCDKSDSQNKFNTHYTTFKDGLFEISNKNFEYHLMKRNKSFNKKMYYIDLLDNACVVMHISPNFYWKSHGLTYWNLIFFAERKFMKNRCSLYFTVGKTPSRSHMWKFVLSGFLEQNSLLMSMIRSTGHPHGTGKTVISEWDEVSKNKRGKLECKNLKNQMPSCKVTSQKKNIQLFAEYYIKAPSHDRTMRFKLDFYKWSYSWANFVIHPSNRSLDAKTEELPEINTNFFYYIKKIVMKKEAAFRMHILSNHTTNLEIQVYSFLSSGGNLNWSNMYEIQQNQSQTIMIVYQVR